jgi:hypothetical protein
MLQYNFTKPQGTLTLSFLMDLRLAPPFTGELPLLPLTSTAAEHMPQST